MFRRLSKSSLRTSSYHSLLLSSNASFHPTSLSFSSSYAYMKSYPFYSNIYPPSLIYDVKKRNYTTTIRMVLEKEKQKSKVSTPVPPSPSPSPSPSTTLSPSSNPSSTSSFTQPSYALSPSSSSSSSSTPLTFNDIEIPDYHTDPLVLPSSYLPIEIQVKIKGNPKLKPLKTSQNSFKITETLSFLHLLLQTNQMERVEEIYYNLSMISPKTMDFLRDTNMLNLFIQGYVQRVSSTYLSPLHRALKWFTNLKKHRLTPNAMSYALIFNGFIKGDQFNQLHSHLKELKEQLNSELLVYIVNHPMLTEGLNQDQQRKLKSILQHYELSSSLLPESTVITSTSTSTTPSTESSFFTVQETTETSTTTTTFSESSSLCEDTSQPKDSLSTDSSILSTSTTPSTPHTATTPWLADQYAISPALPVNSCGLQWLLQNLSHLSTLNPQHMSPFDLYSLQLKLESEAYDVAFQRMLKLTQVVPSVAFGKTEFQALMWEWHETLTKAFEKELKKNKGSSFPSSSSSKFSYLEKALNLNIQDSHLAYLNLMSPEKLSKITIMEVLNLLIQTKTNDSDSAASERPSFSSFSSSSSSPLDLNDFSLNESTSTSLPDQGCQRFSKCVISIGSAILDEINAHMFRQQFKLSSSTPSVSNSNENSSRSTFYQHYLHERDFSSRRLFHIGVSRLKKQHLPLKSPEVLVNEDILNFTHPSKGSSLLLSHPWCFEFPLSLKLKIGTLALQLFMDSAKLPRLYTDPITGAEKSESVPVCFHSYAYFRGHRHGVLQFHPTLLEWVAKGLASFSVSLKLLPMVVKPKPWVSVRQGGYFTSRNLCMRIKHHNTEQRSYLLGAAQKQQLNWVLASLDVLGETAWRVNPFVLKVVIEAWNSGEAIADFTPHLTPEKIKSMQPIPPEDIETNPDAKLKYHSSLSQFQTYVKNSFSLRCDNNYKIEIARAFVGYDLYFPHNIDFRGRAYPMPPLLNHVSSDLCRGLLTFAKSKKLGERGWFWLKVHLASLYGVDKASFTKREQWVMDHLNDIYDSVDQPLTGKRWWLNCEDPWQFLAACFEVTKAIRSGDPLSYECSLPIHQDGTCNGLQHYSALSGDLSCAKQVNLVKSDRPADVYLAVAEYVQKLVHEDALKGNEHAKLLDGHITRKIVKQTVMTFVYGVTFVGARTQIHARLKESLNLDARALFLTSTYLAKKVMKSIQHLFTRAQELQQWLNTVARRIAYSVGPDEKDLSKGYMSSVIWTTPLGLTCVQPYRRESCVSVTTSFQRVSLADPYHVSPVNTSKQKSAFPPNFIHSLDSSHMMLTAIECYRRGLTFASVHDSYWTHASDIDQMNFVIRQMFIKLHSQPILENLLKELQKRYEGYLMPLELKYTKPPKLSSKKKSSSLSSSSMDPNQVEDLEKAQDTLKTSGIDLGEELNLVKQKDELLTMNEETQALFEEDEEEHGDMEHENFKDQHEYPSKVELRKVTKGKYKSFIPLEFPPLPHKGGFNIDQVMESDYFFH